MSGSIPATFVHLASWLFSANDAHPLLVERLDDDLLAPLDEMMRDLDVAAPLRLSQRRRAFRALKSFDSLIEMRAELLSSSLLARAGIPFDFGADHPDLLLGAASCGIEIGTRRLDGPRRLFERLDEVAHESRLESFEIALHFDHRLLKIADAQVARAVEEITSAVIGGASKLRIEDLGLTVEAWAGPGRITMFNQTLGVSLTDHVPDLIREFTNKISEKRRQASTMPTLLMLDFSRVGDAWMIANETWSRELERLLDAEPAEDVAYFGFGLMISSLDQYLPTKLAAVVRDDAPRQLHDAFAGVTKLYDSAKSLGD